MSELVSNSSRLTEPGFKYVLNNALSNCKTMKNKYNNQLFNLGIDSKVADTPGFNRPDLRCKPNELAKLFPELRSQLEKNTCRFRDCLHRDEPGCVLERSGERYYLYRKILDEMLNCRRQ